MAAKLTLRKTLVTFKEYLLITLGLLLYTLAWSVFLLPNNLVGGGITGLGSIIQYSTGFNVAYSYVIINAILVLIAMKVLGGGFGAKTIYALVVTGLFLRFLPGLIPQEFISNFTADNGKLMCVIFAGAMVGLGIAIFLNPIAAVETLVRTIGWVLAGFGVVMLVSAFMTGDPVHNAVSELVLGVLCLAIGLVMAMSPRSFVTIVWTFIGIIVLATGVLDLIEAGGARRTGSPLGLPASVSGCITVFLGAVTILSPFAFPELAMLVAAVVLLVDGITEIIFGLGM